MSLGRTSMTAAALLGACGCAVLLLAADASPATRQPPLRLVQRGSTTLPGTALDGEGREVKITGLSGITWLGGDRYAAIMDNSDTLILFSLAVARDGSLQEPTDVAAVRLAEYHDYEDVVVCPEPLRERIVARRLKQGLPDPGECLLACEEDTPAVRAISLSDGSLLGVVPIPETFATRRHNRGLESLGVDADGRHLWTANEEALPADGPPGTAAAGTVVRFARIAVPESGETAPEGPIQLAYAVDPPHEFARVFAGEPLSGVVAITAVGDRRLLVLERSGCPGLPPFENRIYLVDPETAPDVTAVDHKLISRPELLLAKDVLWRDQLGCNLEGLCLGPILHRGSRAVLAIADNNGIGTPNQLIGFVLDVTPTGVPLSMIAGAAAVAAALGGLMLYRLAR